MRLRASLAYFASKMEEVLRENDDKDGWESMGSGELAIRIDEELTELREAIHSGTNREIRDECCDIANFAMMLHDNLSPKTVTTEHIADHGCSCDDHCMFHKGD